MADQGKVAPTPIQRNLQDVAVDLTNLYYHQKTAKTVEEMQETYLKFYAVAVRAYQGEIDLDRYLPK